MTRSSPQPTAATRGWRLQTKLIVSMLLVGVVPLLVGLGMAFWQGSKEIHEVSGESSTFSSGKRSLERLELPPMR